MHEVNNNKIFGEKRVYFLDSIGFGDSTGQLDDLAILSILHCKIMSATTYSGLKINGIFIF